MSVEESGHLVAIVVPVVLVLLIVATVITWQLRREYAKQCYFNPKKVSGFNFILTLSLYRDKTEKRQPEHVSSGSICCIYMDN